MTRMKWLAAAAGLALTLPMATPAIAQASSYKAGSVWTASRIKVLPGQFENYMDWLAGQWKKIQEFGKKEGVVVSYHVLAVNNARADEPNLILLVETKDYLTNAQQEALNNKINAMLASDDRKQAAGNAERGAMRQPMGSVEYQELVLQ